jgi:hypothetical protein
VVSVVDLRGRWKIVGRGRRVGVSVTEVVSHSGRNSLLPRVFAAEISARAAAVTINYRYRRSHSDTPSSETKPKEVRSGHGGTSGSP